MRMRVASDYDVTFVKSLRRTGTTSNDRATNEALQRAMINGTTRRRRGKSLEPAVLTTEVDENVVTARASAKAIASLSPMAKESMRYLASNDVERRVYVKPYPDPRRVKETTWLTEEGLQDECYGRSTNWIRAGMGSAVDNGDDGAGTTGGLGRVYLEVLECRGLPNTDAGASLRSLLC